ncbi:MAG TPA: alpha/beta hydrolase [Candidatus Margulisiibacteriota bacterium]|nr:alpha/beta hydrolase [Candidatus Margulisiibacteriota bacterium]
MLIERLIFQPDRDVPLPPRGVEERWMRTADGVRLHAWYAGDAGAAPTLLWSHGNGGNIAGRADVLLALAAHGLNVLAYDYRGYGKSEGSPTEAGVYLDAQAVYDSERRRGTPPQRIVAFGESLGGAVSVQLARTRPCAGVAVVSTFTTMRDVARAHFGALGLLSGGRFNSLAHVAKLSVPIFVAHGDRDEIVPFALGKQLFNAAAQPKRFFRAKGAHHNDVFAAAGLIDAIAAFAHGAAGSASC